MVSFNSTPFGGVGRLSFGTGILCFPPVNALGNRDLNIGSGETLGFLR
jgi:hypothetical protein